MAFTTAEYTSFSGMIAANPALRALVWSRKVKMDSRGKNALREMIGAEGSGMPVIEKQDLRKGGSESVIFMTQAGIGGQGILGEAQLRGNTAKHRFGEFQVRVDMLRHAVAYTDVMRQMTAMGTTLEQASAQVMSDWQGKKEEDDLQCALRRAARMGNTAFYGNNLQNYPQQNTTPGGAGANLYIANGEATIDSLHTADTLATTDLERLKALLSGNGGVPMRLDRDRSGGGIERYMYLSPQYGLVGLRGSTNFMQAMREGDVRGKENSLFTGKYQDWNDCIIYPHNVKRDTSSGRQGSPWQPFAYLGAATTNANLTVLPGGGTYLPAAVGMEYDFFANFPGFPWLFTSYDTAIGESGTLYAMIYNLTNGNYEVVSYTNGSFDAFGNTMTVVRGTSTGLVGGGACNGNVLAQAAGRFSTTHPQGSIIVPCTSNGVPFICGALMGEQALYYAKGKYDSEQIMDREDGWIVGSEVPMIKSLGVMSIRGLSPYTDTNGIFPNFILCYSAAPAGFMGITAATY